MAGFGVWSLFLSYSKRKGDSIDIWLGYVAASMVGLRSAKGGVVTGWSA